MISETGSTAEIGDSGDVGDSLAVAALSLARRFAAGATLWCIAPEWPEHARHVAVEFVHPVLVGKRALPAVSIDSPQPVVASAFAGASRRCRFGGESQRLRARSSTSMRRAEAWGATTIWIGVGHRPADRAADHVLWADDARQRRQHRVARRSAGAAVSRALGADTRLLRASRPAVRQRRRLHRRGVHHVLRRRPARRGDLCRCGPRRGAYGERHRDDRHDPRLRCGSWRSRLDPRGYGRSRRCRERRHRLPVSVHRR